ncbi:hypothetical protein CLAIMM_08528 [Cladophialophora immunda]|nr:hypothetical protein CLAIMM_08528 [Cladophialophora immunda]
MLFYLFLSPIAFFVFLRCYGLLNNYIVARRFKLPLIILPASFEDPWFVLLKPLLWWVELLPFGLGEWYAYTELGWPTVDGVKTVSRVGGETFVLVTPTRNQICTAYPPAADQIYRDMKTWIMPAPFSQVFTFYGQNVSSLNGADWQRHRKITAPAFSDQTMRYVWDQSIARVTEDLSFLAGGRCTLATMRCDFNVLAMHVLATVGFGQDSAALKTIPPGHWQTLLESLDFILKHIFAAILFAGLKAPDAILPPLLQRLKLSVAEFRMYMEEAVLRQLQQQKTGNNNSSPSKPGLLEAMVSANEAEKSRHQTTTTTTTTTNFSSTTAAPAKPSYLTDSELYGNLFVFHMAGFETTAGTMSFALPYLALHPEIQDWVTEEVDRCYTHRPNASYHETYPKLVRCMALMYETLRLAGPAPQMIRTPTVPTVLPVSSPAGDKRAKSDGSPAMATTTTVTVPPNTLVTAHFYAMHLSPRWGGDAHLFNPRRFISVTRGSPDAGGEALAIPSDDKGGLPSSATAMFMPWLFGPRVCPGKKFSQVEFVAVVAQILSRYRVEVDVGEGGGQGKRAARGDGREGLRQVLGEKYFNISTHVKRPGDASLRFVRRRA